MSNRLPAMLRGYRLFSAAMGPLTPLFLARRLRHGKEHSLRVSERRGVSVTARPPGPLVWLHGASIGELISVLPLIERIHARGINVLVTSGTVTSGGLAEQRLPRGVIHQFVPIDVPMFVRRFLDNWQPDLALFVESELWPNIMIETSRRGVPMILVNGRLSENSFRRWRLFPVTIGNLLGRLDLCLARTPADAERLGELGAPHVVTTGDLKLDGPAPPADAAKLAALKSAIGGRAIIAAASTHAGEEAAMIDAHQRLRANFPGLLTMIVPRHPERGIEVAEIARAAGLKVRLRSRGELPDAATDIYVADTVGELGLDLSPGADRFCRRLAGRTRRAESDRARQARRRHSARPACLEFRGNLRRARPAHGAEPIADASKLTAGFAALLAQPEARARVAEAARATVEGLSGALERTLHSLDPYLMQLRLHQRADNA